MDKNYTLHFDNMKNGIIITDKNHSIKYINSSATSILSLNPDIRINKVIPECLRKSSSELKITDDLYIDCNICQFNIDEILQFMITLSDITDMVKTKEKNKDLEIRFAHLQKIELLGTLVGGIAHDYNNILTGIIGFISLAMRKLSPDHAVYRYLKHIKSFTDKAIEFNGQLLLFTKLDISSSDVININILIENLFKMMKRILGEMINIQTSLADDLDTISGNHIQIEQIIVNLLINSAKNIEKNGGKLLIKTYNCDSNNILNQPGICLEISNDGPIIEFKDIDQIFDRDEKTIAGSALDLSDIREIIHNHHGKISVESSSENGTIFKVYFPNSNKSIPDPDALYDGINVALLSGKCILLIEDDLEVLKSLRLNLENHGINVFTSSNIKDARAIFQKESALIDLVITDISLPDGNGYDFSQELCNDKPETKVMLISAYPKNVIDSEKLDEKKIWFLKKPFSPELLLTSIYKMIG